MTPLLLFLSGDGPDKHGRTLEEVLLFDDEKLEQDHYYIQWLFPLETMSENVWDSPILTKEEKHRIKTSPVAQANIRRALELMGSFYASTDRWLDYDDHNHLRITRILIATRSLLGHDIATAFYEMLLKRINDTQASISPDNMEYWKEAVGLTLRRGTKIYLDIDGTLIHEDLTNMYGKPAAGLQEFLIALRPYDTFWLTTHCMDGDPMHAQKKLKEVLPEEFYADVDRIQATAWQILKIEGIDWNSDFIWFDNEIFEGEWERFKTAAPDQRVIEVNLRENPTQLEEITRDILT